MKKRILLIDASESFLAKFVPILVSLNFEVTCLATVEEGITILGGEKFDVVVMDLKNGERILFFMEMSLVPPQKRVIVTSESFAEVEASKFHEFISSVLPKPFVFDDLLREIEGN